MSFRISEFVISSRNAQVWTAFIRAVLVCGATADDLAQTFGLAPGLTHEFVDLIAKSYSCFIQRMAITLLQLKMAQGITADIRDFCPEMEDRVADLERECLDSFTHLLSPRQRKKRDLAN
jgi:hypothetical protein